MGLHKRKARFVKVGGGGDVVDQRLSTEQNEGAFSIFLRCNDHICFAGYEHQIIANNTFADTGFLASTSIYLFWSCRQMFWTGKEGKYLLVRWEISPSSLTSRLI